MIHEEICTYEVCKLAKEKGYPQKFNYSKFTPRYNYYNHNEELHGDVGDILKLRLNHEPIPEEMKPITAPTHSQLQRWLREEKGYYVYPFFDNEKLNWTYVVREKTGDMWIPLIGETPYYDCFDETMEDALKFVLKNFV